MKKIGFIGGYDKADLIIYTAKILTELGNKVLVLDTTQKQKLRYIVPTINPTISFVTEFQKIDVAGGFENIGMLKDYLGMGEEEFDYDYVLVDVDNVQRAINIGLSYTDKAYFVTGFDLYSLKRGVEILSDLNNPLKLTKIYFSRTFYNEDDEYLEFLSLGKKVEWEENTIYFPLENGDETAIAENQRLGKIKFKNLSPEYKQGIITLINNIYGEKNRDLKNIIKNLE